jgi:hypothetical protein
LKLVIEIVSPVLTVNEYPFWVAVNPAILIVNGVMDWADRIEVLTVNKKSKIPLCIKMILIIQLRQLEIAEWG